MGRDSYSNRWTVEDCKTITTPFLNKNNYFTGGVKRGEITWSLNGKNTGSISIIVSMVKGDEYIQFQYMQTDMKTDETTKLDYKARISSTPCYFGGRRWWFICPLVVNGLICRRRVGSLHLDDGKYFGCRHCLNLTYTSCQESHKYGGRLFRDIGITEKQAKVLFQRAC